MASQLEMLLAGLQPYREGVGTDIHPVDVAARPYPSVSMHMMEGGTGSNLIPPLKSTGTGPIGPPRSAELLEQVKAAIASQDEAVALSQAHAGVGPRVRTLLEAVAMKGNIRDPKDIKGTGYIANTLKRWHKQGVADLEGWRKFIRDAKNKKASKWVKAGLELKGDVFKEANLSPREKVQKLVAAHESVIEPELKRKYPKTVRGFTPAQIGSPRWGQVEDALARLGQTMTLSLGGAEQGVFVEGGKFLSEAGTGVDIKESELEKMANVGVKGQKVVNPQTGEVTRPWKTFGESMIEEENRLRRREPSGRLELLRRARAHATDFSRMGIADMEHGHTMPKPKTVSLGVGQRTVPTDPKVSKKRLKAHINQSLAKGRGLDPDLIKLATALELTPEGGNVAHTLYETPIEVVRDPTARVGSVNVDVKSVRSEFGKVGSSEKQKQAHEKRTGEKLKDFKIPPQRQVQIDAEEAGKTRLERYRDPRLKGLGQVGFPPEYGGKAGERLVVTVGRQPNPKAKDHGKMAFNKAQQFRALMEAIRTRGRSIPQFAYKHKDTAIAALLAALGIGVAAGTSEGA